MQQETAAVNDVAPLVNLGILLAATRRAEARPRHLPGILSFYSFAGWGKTYSASYVANTLDCHHIQILNFWNRTGFFENLCTELGITPKKNTITYMGGQICEYLGTTQKTLIVDEVDIAIKHGYVDDIRAIWEGSKNTIVMIGEENLPDKLLRWERIHSRVLEWVPAQPPDIQDASTLVKRFARDGIVIADDLIPTLHKESGASVRRICVNIEQAQDFAQENGLLVVDLAAWKSSGRKFYAGSAPSRGNGPSPSKGRR